MARRPGTTDGATACSICRPLPCPHPATGSRPFPPFGRTTLMLPISPRPCGSPPSEIGPFPFVRAVGCGHRTAEVLTPTMRPALDSSGPAVTALASMLWFYGVMRVEAAVADVITGVMPGAALGGLAWLCGEMEAGAPYSATPASWWPLLPSRPEGIRHGAPPTGHAPPRKNGVSQEPDGADAGGT